MVSVLMYGQNDESGRTMFNYDGGLYWYGDAGGRWHREAREREQIQKRHAEALEREEAEEQEMSTRERSRYIEKYGKEAYDKNCKK